MPRCSNPIHTTEAHSQPQLRQPQL
eukprot:COSAG02_NODE_50968_length_317_cov_0.715596_1_plen_24_part_10